MMNQAHISYPFLLAVLIGTLFGYHFSTFELFVIMLSAWLPDLDYLFFVIFKDKSKKYPSHHYYLTHAPLFYLPFLLVLFWYNWKLGWLVFYGLTTHFVMDSLISSEGVRWFYPFRKKFYLWTDYTRNAGNVREWLAIYKKLPIYIYDNLAFFLTIGLVLYLVSN